MSRNHLIRMVLLFTEGDGSGDTTDYTISVTELKKATNRLFRVTVENLETHEVFNSPKDNAKILEVMPLEFWPPFAQQSLLAGSPDEQSPLF